MKVFGKRIKVEHILLVCVFLIILFVIFCSFEYRIDVNHADEQVLYEKLIELDGIGDILATRIIENRPYESWYDLEYNVDGIGDVKIELLRKRFSLRQ